MKLDASNLSLTRWYLDFDGSLCPHQESWEKPSYDSAVIASTLNKLRSKSSGVLWNTGRRIESLHGVNADFLKFSGYFIQGSYFWDAENKSSLRLGPKLPEKISQFFEKALLSHPEFRLEIKDTSLRVAPVERKHLGDLKNWLGAETGWIGENWRWCIGHRGAELLARGFDKGESVKRDLSLVKVPRQGKTIPVSIGDDLLDKAAAEAALSFGGIAISVGDECNWISQMSEAPRDRMMHFETPELFMDYLQNLVGD